MSGHTNELFSSNRQEFEQNGRSSDTLIIKDNIFLSKGFTQVPNAVLEHPAISFGAKLTYAILLKYAWQKDRCFPGQEAVAKDLGVSRRAIINYLNELRENGLIEVKRRGLGLTNIYYIVTDFTPDVNAGSLPEVNQRSQPDTNRRSHKEYSSKNTKKEEYEEDSNLRNASAKNSKKEGSRGDPTYSHIDRGAIRNEENRNRGQSKDHSSTNHSSIKTELQQRVDEITKLAKSKPPTLPNGYTEEEDAIAIYIEDYSRVLNDQTHIKSNVKQAINIFQQIKSEIPGLEVEHYLFILETFKDIVKMRANVKNKGAYYFKSLRNHLWPGTQ